MTPRSTLLRRVQIANFAMHEAILYLDAYPNDTTALAYFKKYRDIAAQATAEFEKLYGPLTAAASNDATWTWVNNPWPWELEANS